MKRWFVELWPYLVAAALVAAAFAIRLLLVPQLGWREPFALFYFAILISAWYGGLGPGVLAMVLALPLAVGYFIRPMGSMEIAYSRDTAAMMFFLLLGTAICIGAEAFRRARSALRAHEGREDQAAAILHDQQRLLQTVVDEVPVLIGYLDRGLVIRLYNRCFEQWFGGGSLHGIHFETLMAEQFSEEDALALHSALSGNRIDYQRILANGEGSQRHVRCVVLPHTGIGAAVTGVVLHIQDETESILAQKRLIASERRFRSLVQASTSIVLRIRPDGGIIEAQGWAEYTGSPPPERFEQVADQVEVKDRERLGRAWAEAIAAEELEEIEFLLRHDPSQQYRYTILSFVAIPDRDGEPQEWVGMIRDIHDRRQAEIRLRRQERDLRLVLNTTSARISYIDVDGSIRWVNRMTERWSGRSSEELRGRSVEAILGGQEGQWMSRQLQKAASGRPVEFEWSVEHPLLGLRWSRSSITPDLDSSGDIAGYVLLCLDITQRRRMEEDLRRSEAEYRVLSEYVPHLVWIADCEGHPYFFNRRWQEYMGTTPSHPWLRIAHPDDVGHTNEAWQEALRSGNDLVVETRFQRGSDSSWRWHVVRAVPLKESGGSITRWYGTCTDIEDQKRAQKILTQAARKTDEFLGMLSHELRNPLAAISSAAGALALHVTNETRRKEACETVLRQTAVMRRMVDDLLDTARVSHGKIELRLQATDLQALLEQIVDDLRLRLRSIPVAIRLLPATTSTTAVVDAVRIQQCVDNLVTNAVRASASGQAVEVSLEAGRSAQELSIVVRDQGLGIEADLLDAIFDPFVQGSSSTGSLGLGLALVRKVAALHGGQACAESDGPGRGATFRIYLARSSLQPAEEAPSRLSFRKTHVLLIDDERDNVQALRLFLEVVGHTVDTAYDGDAGFELAISRNPTVVVCDLGLPPPTSGYEVAKRLRAAGRTNMYLIAFSGYGRADDLERSRKAGFDLHIVKPASPQIIERAIQDGAGSR